MSDKEKKTKVLDACLANNQNLDALIPKTNRGSETGHPVPDPAKPQLSRGCLLRELPRGSRDRDRRRVESPPRLVKWLDIID